MSSRRPLKTEAARQGRRNKSWSKDMERDGAGILGNREWRIHDGAGKTADIETPRAVYEVKATRSNGPVWLQEATRQRREGMEQSGKPGYIIFTCMYEGRRVWWRIEPLTAEQMED